MRFDASCSGSVVPPATSPLAPWTSEPKGSPHAADAPPPPRRGPLGRPPLPGRRAATPPRPRPPAPPAGPPPPAGGARPDETAEAAFRGGRKTVRRAPEDNRRALAGREVRRGGRAGAAGRRPLREGPGPRPLANGRRPPPGRD